MTRVIRSEAFLHIYTACVHLESICAVSSSIDVYAATTVVKRAMSRIAFR